MFLLLLNSTFTVSRLSCISASRLAVRKRLWGDIAKRADLRWAKRYSIPYDIVCSNKCQEKGGGLGAFSIKILVFQSNIYAYWSPTFQAVAGHCLLTGNRKYTLSFSFASTCSSFLFLLNCLYLDLQDFSLIFHLSCWRGIKRASWWAPDSQSRSTDHRPLWCPTWGMRNLR